MVDAAERRPPLATAVPSSKPDPQSDVPINAALPNVPFLSPSRHSPSLEILTAPTHPPNMASIDPRAFADLIHQLSDVLSSQRSTDGSASDYPNTPPPEYSSEYSGGPSRV